MTGTFKPLGIAMAALGLALALSACTEHGRQTRGSGDRWERHGWHDGDRDRPHREYRHRGDRRHDDGDRRRRGR